MVFVEVVGQILVVFFIMGCLMALMWRSRRPVIAANKVLARHMRRRQSRTAGLKLVR